MVKPQVKSREIYEANLRRRAEPVRQEWMGKVGRKGLLNPRVAYGYFPCGRDGNAVVVFDPQDRSRRLGRFELPRQRSGNRYCIADFYRDPAGDSPTDGLPIQAVPMGARARQVAQEPFAADPSRDYL